MSQAKLTIDQIRIALEDVKFMDRKFLVMEKGDGFLIQMSYMEEDVDNPGAGPMEQKTRKWYASPFMTESELVETCWAMVCRSQMHIAGEHFTYKGRRVYSPHFDVNARIRMCDEQQYDCREPINAVACDCWMVAHMTGGHHKTNCPNYKEVPFDPDLT